MAHGIGLEWGSPIVHKALITLYGCGPSTIVGGSFGFYSSLKALANKTSEFKHLIDVAWSQYQRGATNITDEKKDELSGRITEKNRLANEANMQAYEEFRYAMIYYTSTVPIAGPWLALELAGRWVFHSLG